MAGIWINSLSRTVKTARIWINSLSRTTKTARNAWEKRPVNDGPVRGVRIHLSNFSSDHFLSLHQFYPKMLYPTVWKMKRLGSIGILWLYWFVFRTGMTWCTIIVLFFGQCLKKLITKILNKFLSPKLLIYTISWEELTLWNFWGTLIY